MVKIPIPPPTAPNASWVPIPAEDPMINGARKYNAKAQGTAATATTASFLGQKLGTFKKVCQTEKKVI
ncbi:hypothetical protein, partial [Wolbachia endosymbiont of Nasonia oneida]